VPCNVNIEGVFIVGSMLGMGVMFLSKFIAYLVMVSLLVIKSCNNTEEALDYKCGTK
jgi:hypothetical protein